MREYNRIVFLGTPEFAVPILRALYVAKWQIIGVVTQPDRIVGRKRILTPPPVKVVATELGLPVFQPERVKATDALEVVKEWQPDFLITVAYGQLLSEKLLKIAKFASLNVHASLLPKYRGASPIQSAILHGEKETGISIMNMVKEMDAGPVWSQAMLDIEQADNYGLLSERLSLLGAELLIDTLPKILDHSLQPVPQDEQSATYCSLLKREDEWLDFSDSAQGIVNKIRALAPTPGATARLDDQVVKCWDASLTEISNIGSVPGQIIGMDQEGILVACNPGVICLHRLQMAGKKNLSGIEFARGLRNLTGNIFLGKPGTGEMK